MSLPTGSVGVDHNPDSIAHCQSLGLEAYTTEELAERADRAAPGSFDSLLMAHLLEHVDEEIGDDILRQYLPYLKAGGKVAVLTPQEVGFRSDETQ